MFGGLNIILRVGYLLRRQETVWQPRFRPRLTWFWYRVRSQLRYLDP